VKKPDGIADCGHLATRHRQQPVHRHTIREVRQPHRPLLDVARVDVDHAVRRLRADPLDKRRDAR
jgi:hypothetical protein